MAPDKWKNSVSYWTGALTSAAWFFWNAGTALLTAQILSAAVMATFPNYTAKDWQVLLIAWLQSIISFVWNVPLFKTWPYSLKAMVVISNVGILFIAISLLVRASPKQSARTVFVDVVNESGWGSKGVVFFLGLLPGSTAINGFDSAAHMVEEMPDPARQVPQVMVGNAFLSGISGLVMAIIYCFCITNVDNLFEPVGGVTVVQILHDSLHSEALFLISTIIYVLTTIIAASCCLTTCSRVWWSFSEHNGLPFSSWFSTIDKTWKVPVNSICVICVLSVLIVLLDLGPSFVLAALFSAANVCFYISYFITICCFLWRRRKTALPKHYLDLGRFTNIIGVISLVWAVFVSVWLMIPYYLPVTSEGMNYTVAVSAFVIVLFAADWFLRARRSYFIPSPLLI